MRDLRKRKSRWGDQVEGKEVGGVYVGIVCGVVGGGCEKRRSSGLD